MWTVVACEQAGPSKGDAAPAASSDDPTELYRTETRSQPLLKDLGPAVRRVNVIVLPGDATVDVDGIRYRRRDGIIELTGKVGEPHRFRVVKGSQSIEKEVIIPEAGAPPPLLDLNARSAEKPIGSGGAARPAASGSARPAAPATNPMLPDDFQ
jgi:serine/threonine-protein kinase